MTALKHLCHTILLLLLASTTAHAETSTHHLISIGENNSKAEVTGYECSDDTICRIKVMLSSRTIVTASTWIANKTAFVLFKTNETGDKYLNVSSAHQDERQYLAIKLENSDCIKEPIMLYADGSGLLRDMTCDEDCTFAKLLITICPKK